MKIQSNILILLLFIRFVGVCVETHCSSPTQLTPTEYNAAIDKKYLAHQADTLQKDLMDVLGVKVLAQLIMDYADDEAFTTWIFSKSDPHLAEFEDFIEKNPTAINSITVNARNKYGCSILHCVVRKKNILATERLVELNPDFDTHGIPWKCKNGSQECTQIDRYDVINLPIAQLLVGAGADPAKLLEEIESFTPCGDGVLESVQDFLRTKKKQEVKRKTQFSILRPWPKTKVQNAHTES